VKILNFDYRNIKTKLIS